MIEAILGIWLAKKFTIPRRRCTADLSVGVGIFEMATILAESGLTPSAPITVPKYFTYLLLAVVCQS